MKKLNISVILKDFKGKEIETPDKQKLTLKDVVLQYLELAHTMECKDKTAAYTAGLLVGIASESVVLDQRQYDVIKGLVDSNKVKNPQTKEESDVYGIVVNQQVKDLIDKAEEVKK